jgi:tetratricopeptide (TPR) repeat protein
MGFFKNIWRLVTSKEKRRWLRTYNKATYNAIFRQRYDIAIDQLNELLNSDACSYQNRYSALGFLGEVHVWKGEYEKAKDYLEEALDLSLKAKERSSELYDFLGYAYFKTGDYTGALKFFRLACKYANRGFLNRIYMKHIGKTEERKTILEEHEDFLPFLTAYYKQNKRKYESPSK